MPKQIIIDCDPGHDDALAILLAVASPETELLAVTTCFGNCSLEDATRNAIQILDAVGEPSIPVAAGASRAITGEAALGNYVHGSSGLDGPVLPLPSREPDPRGAIAVMSEILENSSRPVTLVVTGPMTNAARLVRDRPDLIPSIAEIIFMGGSTERGNHTPSAEFNTFADPEALADVIDSGVQLRMVGLNLTHQALATPEVVHKMTTSDSPVARLCAEWLGFFRDSYHRVWDFEAPPVHDPTTVAALIRPDLITWRPAFLAVELQGRWTRGETVVDFHRRYPEEDHNVLVAVKLNAEGFWDLVFDSINSLGP